LAGLRNGAGPNSNGAASVPSNGTGPDHLAAPNGSATNGSATSGSAASGHGSTDVFGTPADEPAVVSGDLASEWQAFSGTAIRELESDLDLAPTDFTWFIPEFAPDDAEPGAMPRKLPPRVATVSAPAPASPPAVSASAAPASDAVSAPAPSVPAPASPAPSAVPADEPASYAYTAVGLPRRVPRSHVVPSLMDRPAAGPQPKPAPAAPAAPTPAATAAPTAQRNPSRARGFLNDYQSGIRQGARSREETAAVPESMDNGDGEVR
jgi:hypothetical protein